MCQETYVEYNLKDIYRLKFKNFNPSHFQGEYIDLTIGMTLGISTMAGVMALVLISIHYVVFIYRLTIEG